MQRTIKHTRTNFVFGRKRTINADVPQILKAFAQYTARDSKPGVTRIANMSVTGTVCIGK